MTYYFYSVAAMPRTGQLEPWVSQRQSWETLVYCCSCVGRGKFLAVNHSLWGSFSILIGPGSTLLYAQEVIGALHSIIPRLKRELGVDRIRLLDIPCGDMVWMSRFLKTRDDVHYTGLDIVPGLISRHQKDFVGQSNWTFRVQDIVHNGLNESYDLILCRMMLQHLFNQDVLTVLKHFSQSGSRFLLTTSFSRASANVELPVVNTRFRELNLELPPVSLIPPVCFLRDGERDDHHGRNHFLGLWPLPIRRVKLCNSTSSFRVPGFGVDFFSCTKWS